MVPALLVRRAHRALCHSLLPCSRASCHSSSAASCSAFTSGAFSPCSVDPCNVCAQELYRAVQIECCWCMHGGPGSCGWDRLPWIGHAACSCGISHAEKQLETHTAHQSPFTCTALSPSKTHVIPTSKTPGSRTRRRNRKHVRQHAPRQPAMLQAEQERSPASLRLHIHSTPDRGQAGPSANRGGESRGRRNSKCATDPVTWTRAAAIHVVFQAIVRPVLCPRRLNRRTASCSYWQNRAFARLGLPYHWVQEGLSSTSIVEIAPPSVPVLTTAPCVQRPHQPLPRVQMSGCP